MSRVDIFSLPHVNVTSGDLGRVLSSHYCSQPRGKSLGEEAQPEPASQRSNVILTRKKMEIYLE